MDIPASIEWLRGQPGGDIWLQTIPALVQELCREWDLQPIGDPFAGSYVSFVIPVKRANERYVLKLQWPDPVVEHEYLALQEWDGQGAVHLIAHDKTRHALLLETCHPGSYLGDAVGIDRVGVMIGLLPRLWIPTKAPFKSLSDAAKEWAVHIPEEWSHAGQPCERALVDAALRFIDELADSQGTQVLVHQDLHGHNVLAAEREPWLVIDPQPLIGEREFSLAPVVRSVELGAGEKATLARLDRLSEELSLDRTRVLKWTVAQTIAGGFGGPRAARDQQIVRWLLAAL